MDYNFTVDEVKEFIVSGNVQLSDDALDNVAGGTSAEKDRRRQGPKHGECM